MKISARLATPADTEKFLQYEAATADNLFDPEAGLYPSSFTLCAEACTENGQTPVLYMPVQRPFVLESLGVAPDASKREIAVSLRRLIDRLMEYAKQAGVGELYFGCKEPETIAFAERHGFEKVPFQMWRLKVENYQ